MVTDKNTYGTPTQLNYWDESAKWQRRVSSYWSLEHANLPRKTWPIDSAVRIPYATATDPSEGGLVGDEHLLIGMVFRDNGVMATPTDTVVLMSRANVDTPPTPPDPKDNSYARLAWLSLLSCAPRNVLEWQIDDDWDTNANKILVDQRGAVWSFRGRPITVERSIFIHKFHIKKTDNKFYEGAMLVGYEGGGAY
jgi:hypothetical protein